MTTLPDVDQDSALDLAVLDLIAHYRHEADQLHLRYVEQADRDVSRAARAYHQALALDARADVLQQQYDAQHQDQEATR